MGLYSVQSVHSHVCSCSRFLTDEASRWSGVGLWIFFAISQCWCFSYFHTLILPSEHTCPERNEHVGTYPVEELGKNVCKQSVLMVHPPPARLIGHETRCELGCGACMSSTVVHIATWIYFHFYLGLNFCCNPDICLCNRKSLQCTIRLWMWTDWKI